MKKIEVVAGVFIKDNKLFSTQRSEGTFKGFWEFPGGKLELGESNQDALKREIREELAAEIIVGDYFTTVNYQYADFDLTMQLYFAEFITLPRMIEPMDMAWFTSEEIDKAKWIPADLPVARQIKDLLL